MNNPLRTLYAHTFNVNRYMEITENYIDRKGIFPVEELQGVRGRFSQSYGNMNAVQSSTLNEVVREDKLFCDYDLDIRCGDRIEIFYRGKSLGRFQAGDPYPYTKHQEVPLTREASG